METNHITLERLSLKTAKAFDSVLAALDAEVGHPPMPDFKDAIDSASSQTEVQAIVQQALGRSGFVEFQRFNLGAALSKGGSQGRYRIVRLLLGNPLIMQEMVREVPDAGSYAPVTVLIDERADGVYLSYDRVESALAAYENPEASRVARELDAQVERLLIAASSVERGR